MVTAPSNSRTRSVMQNSAMQDSSPATDSFYLVHFRDPRNNRKKYEKTYQLRDAQFNILYSAELRRQANMFEQSITIISSANEGDYTLAPKRKFVNTSYKLTSNADNALVAELSYKKKAVQLFNSRNEPIASSLAPAKDRAIADYIVNVLDQDFSRDPQKEYNIESNGRIIAQAAEEPMPVPEEEIMVYSGGMKLLDSWRNKMSNKTYSTVKIELSIESELSQPMLMAFAMAHHYFYVISVHDAVA